MQVYYLMYAFEIIVFLVKLEEFAFQWTCNRTKLACHMSIPVSFPIPINHASFGE